MNYYENYVTVSGHDEINKVKVRLGYELGGRNYISGDMVDRGLWLYVMPVRLETRELDNGHKYQTEQTQPFTWKGYRKLLKQMARKNDKAGKTMAKLVADEVTNKYGTAWQIIKQVIAENNLSLA